MSNSPLDAEQRRFYDENGYLVVRGFFEPKDLEPWLERFLAIVEGRVPPAELVWLMAHDFFQQLPALVSATIGGTFSHIRRY